MLRKRSQDPQTNSSKQHLRYGPNYVHICLLDAYLGMNTPKKLISSRQSSNKSYPRSH
ncbi:hypothetical protein AN958_12419 [Leucoagaricus sp. SymC.cos]|nr:hypothetical protein AN958_12419 [Leucoagaricus sp. SymC.cos]